MFGPVCVCVCVCVTKLYHSHYGVWHGYYVINDTGTTTYYRPDRNPQEVVGLDNFDGHFTFIRTLLHWATIITRCNANKYRL